MNRYVRLALYVVWGTLAILFTMVAWIVGTHRDLWKVTVTNTRGDDIVLKKPMSAEKRHCPAGTSLEWGSEYRPYKPPFQAETIDGKSIKPIRITEKSAPPFFGDAVFEITY